MNNMESKQSITEKEIDEEIRKVILKSLIGKRKEDYGVIAISNLYYNMKLKVGTHVKTMAVTVGDMTLHINPDFYTENKAYIKGLLLHEMMHVLGFNDLYFIDKEIKYHKLMNIATDIIINYLLLSDDIKLPSCGIIPDVDDKVCRLIINNKNIFISNIDKKSWIDIYNELKEKVDIEDIEMPFDEGILDMDKVKDNEKVKEDVRVFIGKAKDSVRSAGLDIKDSHILTHINKLKVNQKMWYKQLYNKLRNIAFAKMYFKTDKYKKKPYLYSQIVYKKKLKGIKCVCVVDVSGSMTENLIVKGINIIYDIINNTGGQLYLISYDERKVGEHILKGHIKDISDIKNNLLISNGGTDISKMLKTLKQNKEYDFKILITDMEDYVSENEYRDLDILITDNKETKLKNAIICEN